MTGHDRSEVGVGMRGEIAVNEPLFQTEIAELKSLGNREPTAYAFVFQICYNLCDGGKLPLRSLNRSLVLRVVFVRGKHASDYSMSLLGRLHQHAPHVGRVGRQRPEIGERFKQYSKDAGYACLARRADKVQAGSVAVKHVPDDCASH